MENYTITETSLCTGMLPSHLSFLPKTRAHPVKYENVLNLTSIQLNVLCTFQSVFLPQGYPDSVSEDYLQYQIWDTIQVLLCDSSYE